MEALAALAGTRCPNSLVSSARCASRGEQSAVASSSSIALHSGLRAVNKDRLYKQTVSFHDKVQNSLKTRGSKSGAFRAQVTMMPIGTPKVPYRTPQEGGWQWVDIWNVLYRERIIFIGQYVDEEFGNQILATMLYLDSIDNTKPMYLYLNSPGGDVGFVHSPLDKYDLLCRGLYCQRWLSTFAYWLFESFFRRGKIPKGNPQRFLLASSSTRRSKYTRQMTPCMAIYDTMESIKSEVGTLALGYAYNNAGLLLSAGAKGLRVAMPMTRIALQSPSGAARGTADDIQNEAKELSRVRNYVFNQVSKKTGQPLEKVTKDLSRIKRFSAQEALDYGLIDRIVRPRRIKADANTKQRSGVGLG